MQENVVTYDEHTDTEYEYYWTEYDSHTYDRTEVSSDSQIFYTHPGTCSAFPNLATIEKPREKSALISPNEVSNWLSHYEKWKAWDNQDTFTLNNPEDYSVDKDQ